MKVSAMKKSLLDYAIKGKLSAKFRRENPQLSAHGEINAYNAQIANTRKIKKKQLATLEKALKEKGADKQAIKSKIQAIKKEIAKLKEIEILALNNEAAFEIPSSWAWVKLGDICEMKKGPFGSAITKDMFIPKSNKAIKIYEQKNAIYKNVDFGEYYISLAHFEKLKQFEVFADDIIVSCAGTIGESYRIPKNNPKGIINQALMKISLKQLEWIAYFLIVFDFLLKEKSQENSKGSAIKNIPELKILKNFLIPLPPLDEQKAIAQKLESLIALASEFEATQENLKKIEKRIEKSLLHCAILGKLSAKFRRENPQLSAFDEIADYNEQIANTRKEKQKQLAKLEKSLKEKGADKQAIKPKIATLKKEIAKLKEIEILALNNEAAFEIPNSWAWVKLGDICEISSGGTPARDKAEFWQNGDIAWVKIADIKSDFIEKTAERITQKGLENSSAKIFPKGTLLYTIFATLGEVGILNIDATTNQAIAGLSKQYKYDTKFLMYVLKSKKDYVNNLGRGLAQSNINQTMLKNFLIPLAPLAEQESIAKKLDALFAISKGLRVE